MTPLKGIATLTRLLVASVPGIVSVIVCGAIIAVILFSYAELFFLPFGA
jgi:hypothetical protein